MIKVKNHDTKFKQKLLNILLLIGIPVITVIVIMSAVKSFDHKKIDIIKEELIVVEDMLQDYLADEETLPVFMTTKIIDNIRGEVSNKTVFNLDGIVKNMDLSQNYYGLPTVITIPVGSKLGGKFISDENRNVYYIHNRKMRL